MSTTLATIRPLPHVRDAGCNRRPDVRVEDEPDRVSLAADPERVEVQEGLRIGDRRADLEHVRAQDLVARRAEVMSAQGISCLYWVWRCREGSRRISSELVTTGLQTIRIGRAVAASRAVAIAFECSATVSRVSGP